MIAFLCSAVGRLYTTTPADLTAVAQKFSLDIATISRWSQLLLVNNIFLQDLFRQITSALAVCSVAERDLACSYKLGHSEVHVVEESNTPLLPPPPSTITQAADQSSFDRDDHAASLNQLPDSRLQQRIQQLESDMTKVKMCSSLQHAFLCQGC